MSAREPRFYSLAIVVSGGIGQATLSARGWTSLIYVDAPSAGAQYILQPIDPNGKPCGIPTQNVDDAIITDSWPLKDGTVFKITGATIDGTYNLTIWEKDF